MQENHVLLACLEAAVLAARQNPDASPYRLARGIHDLQKFGEQLHRRYVNSCNYAYATTDAYGRRTERLEEKAANVAAEANLTIGLQRDPRGWPVILAFGRNEIRIGGRQ